jgi:hypothetical protein
MLNVGFDACDPDFGGSDGALGDLTYIGGPFDGMTVNDVIAAANNFIGGCGGNYTAAQFNTALTNLNENYGDGIVDLGYLLCEKKKEEKRMIVGSDTEEMSIYPVPALEALTVDLPTNDGTAMIALYDMTGREVISQRNVAGVKEVLNVNGIPAGSYLLTVQMNGKVMSNRVIVSK